MPYVQFAVPVKVNPFFAEHGYISVQVRARGLGKSGGEVQFLSPREGLDGKAIIDWAAHTLEGSDGRVGLIGCSWPGAIAMTDAAAVGPGSPLKAAVAACSGMENMHRQSWLNAGLPTMSFWQFAELGPQLTGNSAAGQRYFRRFAREGPQDPGWGGLVGLLWEGTKGQRSTEGSEDHQPAHGAHADEHDDHHQ